ncbi:MAG: hypothetical protein JW785_06040, partial [Acidimicrobiia bacterium]|nr:hypothetical protein [Acidimicrobiia bacterium]
MQGRVWHRRAGLVLLTVVLLIPLSAGAEPAASPKAAPVTGDDFRISGTGATALESEVAAAWNPDADEYLVVWADHRNEAGSGSDIYGRRVAADGALVGEDFPISNTLTDEEEPAIAATDSGYLVVWVDYRKAYPRGA